MKNGFPGKRNVDWVVLVLTAVFFLCFFGQAIFGERVFLAGDQLVYTLPLRTIAWDMIRHGQLPLWTPFVFSGYPLLSMAQLGLGYPLTWGYLFLPNHWAEQIYVFAPYLLAPVFTYKYLCKVGRSRAASLFAGLSFSYGGLMLSGVGLNGMLPNAMMWTPLMLLAIEKSMNCSFVRCLLMATAAFSMAVLTGIGQGFVYAGILAVAYALFLAVFQPRSDDSSQVQGWQWFDRWKPLAVIAGAILFSFGVAAFQILETLRAQKLSVRAELSYEDFSQGSFPFSFAWKTWLDPFHIHGDVTAYAPPLAVLLALISLIVALRGERRIYFWLAVSIVAWILICGSYSPLYRLVYQIPILNDFRVPSRHSFEWTFAVSVMAAYGWDFAGDWLRRRWKYLSAKTNLLNFANGFFWLLLSLAIGIAWRKSIDPLKPIPDPNLEILNPAYLQWKAAFVLVSLIALWSVWRLSNDRWRESLLLITAAVVCFFEPFISIAPAPTAYGVPVSRFQQPSTTTRLLQQHPPEQNRVYTQINLSAEIQSPQPKLDPPNMTAFAGLHNVAGFEPLMLERYSRALNSQAWEQVNRTPTLNADPSLFAAESHVLDLLNTTFVTSFSNFGYARNRTIEKDGIEFDDSFDITDLKVGSPAKLNGGDFEADTLALVTSMARSNHIADETPVARISIHTTEGQLIEKELLAGRDTSEWAHERADVKANIKHRLAEVFDSRPGDAQNSFPSLRYWSKINFGQRLRVERIEIIKLVDDADVGFWHAALFDSSSRNSIQLKSLDLSRWQPVYQMDGVWLTRNKRALPRAWLVTEAEALDATQIWRRIRGLNDRPDDKPFDPRRTALIEIEPGKLPKLSGRELSPDAYARTIKYEANRIEIETNNNEQAILVLSEIHYPGWTAWLDGEKTPIHQTDFLLRGVIVPAGKHKIEMSYRAPQARTGAIISLLTIGLIGWLAIYALRKNQS